MIYTVNNCIRAFGYTNFDKLIADMGSVDNLREYVIANGYADIAVGEDTELLLVDVNGKTWHTGCYGAQLGPEPEYLCFTSNGDSTISMSQYGTPNTSANKVLKYKLNNGQWQTWDLSEVPLSVGDKMYVKSDDEIPVSEAYNIYKYFVMSGSIAASGNIMSLLNFSDTLNDYAFYYLFRNCTSLTQAAELPATTLSPHCYSSMLFSCSSLTQAPELPATTLAQSCYSSMFYGCTSLTAAPALPATTLAALCYYEMFNGCTSLTAAPVLPATTLAMQCYYWMFNRCTSLTTAPELPATTLAQSCYSYMFNGCTSLVQAPELPATTLDNGCYSYMFSGCSNLNYVKAMFTDIPTEGNPVGSWLNNVSPTGTFIKSKDATWTNEQANIPTGWTVQVEGGVTPEPEPERDYLCFTSTGDSTVDMTQEGTPNTSANKVIQYKLNNGQWQTWNLSAVTLHDGDKMYLKSDDEIPISESDSIYKQFTIAGSITASGNIMSLLNFSTTLTAYAFYCLFKDCTSLTAAPKLPATTLAENCYSYMFYNCTSLVQSPELPATTLVFNCYTNMFNQCTSLTQAPALPATTLADGCYAEMFRDCSSLTTAPELPATTLVYGCYYCMFISCRKLNYVKALFTDISAEICLTAWLDNVSSTGTFVKNSAATWNNDNAGIPSGWTVQVEGGVTPEPEPDKDYLCFTSTGDSTVAMTQEGTPTDISKNKVIQYKLNDGQWQTWDLSAVTLHDGDKMYLKSDDEIPFGEQNYVSKNFVMTGSIAASGNIMSLLNFSTTLVYYAFYKLFKNCASLTQAPELPATTLANNCYEQMFIGCTALTTAPELPATELTFGCYMNMFTSCQSLTTAPALPATTLTIYCYSAMFTGCQSLTTAPELPATTLVDGCYFYMFNGCSNLNYVKAMFTEVPTTGNPVSSWLDNVSSTGTFVKNSAATWNNDNAGIPSGWTVQTASPDK